MGAVRGWSVGAVRGWSVGIVEGRLKKEDLSAARSSVRMTLLQLMVRTMLRGENGGLCGEGLSDFQPKYRRGQERDEGDQGWLPWSSGFFQKGGTRWSGKEEKIGQSLGGT